MNLSLKFIFALSHTLYFSTDSAMCKGKDMEQYIL